LAARCVITRLRRCSPCSEASRTAKSASAFRTLKPREAAPARIVARHASAFTFHEVEGDIEPAEEADLLGMIKTDRMTTDRR